MAVPQGQAPQPPRSGMTGSWFWLASSFAATLFFVFPGARFDTAIATLVDHAFPIAIAVVLWSLAGRILGSILRAASPGPAPAWIFRLSGWTIATLAAGILLALQAGDDPRAFRDSEAMATHLLGLACLGLAWWLVLDLARVGLARLAGRADPPFLSVATLAFLSGLGAIGWTVHGYLEGLLTAPPLEAGLLNLAMVLGAGAVLTVAVELPRALLARGRGEGGGTTLATARERLAGQLRVRTGQADAASVLAGAAPTEHGLSVTPPTVVRLR